MSAARKIEEGNQLMVQAEKSLKMGLLKWRPDYDVAADEYSKAATAYRIGKSFDQSKEAFLKAIDCHKNNKSWFHAAKCYEQIILVLYETNNFVQIEENANKACSIHQQRGNPECAARVLGKTAKLVEQTHPDMALRFYQHALEVLTIEDSTRHAAEYVKKVSRLTVKLGMYDQAADAILREIELNQETYSSQQISHLLVALVLVQLARGDSIAAEKAYKEWGYFCDFQKMETLETLLQAYDDEDPDAAIRALSSPFIKHMDVEFAILARDLPLPKGISTAATANPNGASSYKSPNVASSQSGGNPPMGGDDEDEEGDLC